MREGIDEIFGVPACRSFCQGAAERVWDLMTHSLLLTLLVRYGEMLKVRRISIFYLGGPRPKVQCSEISDPALCYCVMVAGQ